MKKLSKLLLLVLVLTFVMAGCGKDKKSDDLQVSTVGNTEGTQEETKTGEDTSLQDIIEKETFILGLDDAFPPMGFSDEDLNIVGFDIDLAREVCRKLGVELQIQPIDWDAKEQELSTKQIDCIWNGLSKTPERDEALTLSIPYMLNTQVAVVLEDSDIQTLADLSGKTVVIQNASSASDAIDANEDFKNSLGELITVKDNVQALFDLGTAGSDAVVMDEVVARYYLEKEPNKYRILQETLSDEEYVIGFRKGEESLCSKIEKILRELKADGTLAEISTKWMGKDLTIVE